MERTLLGLGIIATIAAPLTLVSCTQDSNSRFETMKKTELEFLMGIRNKIAAKYPNISEDLANMASRIINGAPKQLTPSEILTLDHKIDMLMSSVIAAKNEADLEEQNSKYNYDDEKKDFTVGKSIKEFE